MGNSKSKAAKKKERAQARASKRKRRHRGGEQDGPEPVSRGASSTVLTTATAAAATTTTTTTDAAAVAAAAETDERMRALQAAVDVLTCTAGARESALSPTRSIRKSTRRGAGGDLRIVPPPRGGGAGGARQASPATAEGSRQPSSAKAAARASNGSKTARREAPRTARAPPSSPSASPSPRRGGGRASSPVDSPSARSVRAIDKYVLGPVLGRGAFNVVRQATDSETGRPVAIKIFNKSKMAEVKDDTWRKMRKEVGLMHMSSHPYVVGLIDLMETEKRICLTLEYMGGGDLFGLVERRGRLPPTQAMDYFWQVVQAVRHCHSQDICHRDIKPGNILLSTDLRVAKLADFGLARLQKRSLCENSCGSPHYMAPEVFRSAPYDGRAADVWSLGVVLYVMVEAALPFWAESSSAMYASIEAGRYQAPLVPSDVAAVIRRCLVPDPAKRATVMELEGLPAVRRAGRLHRKATANAGPEGGASRVPFLPLDGVAPAAEGAC